MNQEEQRKLSGKNGATFVDEFITFDNNELAAYTAAVEAPLQARIVSVFSEEEHPVFQQGQADHELLEDVTAEYCTNLVEVIKGLNQKILEQQARIKWCMERYNFDALDDTQSLANHVKQAEIRALSDHDKEVQDRERERIIELIPLAYVGGVDVIVKRIRELK